MIRGIDISLLEQTLNYWFIHKLSYASSIFRCLALSLPSDFSFVQPTVTWPFTATQIIWVAQIQHCCLHTALAMRKAVGEWCVCGCTVLLFCTCAWVWMYSLHLLCQARTIFVAYSVSLRFIMRMYFYKDTRLILREMIWNEMAKSKLFVEKKVTWEYWISSCSCTIMNYFRILYNVVIKDTLQIYIILLDWICYTIVYNTIRYKLFSQMVFCL